MDLATPDFAAMAASFQVRAETVDGLDEKFGAALAAHLEDPAPSVLVARAALDPPPTTSPRWYRGHPRAGTESRRDPAAKRRDAAREEVPWSQ